MIDRIAEQDEVGPLARGAAPRRNAADDVFGRDNIDGQHADSIERPVGAKSLLLIVC